MDDPDEEALVRKLFAEFFGPADLEPEHRAHRPGETTLACASCAAVSVGRATGWRATLAAGSRDVTISCPACAAARDRERGADLG